MANTMRASPRRRARLTLIVARTRQRATRKTCRALPPRRVIAARIRTRVRAVFLARLILHLRAPMGVHSIPMLRRTSLDTPLLVRRVRIGGHDGSDLVFLSLIMGLSCDFLRVLLFAIMNAFYSSTYRRPLATLVIYTDARRRGCCRPVRSSVGDNWRCSNFPGPSDPSSTFTDFFHGSCF